MNEYYVYIHTAPNGKKYAGTTRLDPDVRFRNGAGYIRQPQFYEDIKRFGWENFETEIIYKGLNKETAGELETKLIRELNLTDASKGYNIQLGGFHSQKGRRFPGRTSSTSFKKGDIPWNKGISWQSKEEIDKRIKAAADANRGKKHSPERIQKVRDALKHRIKPVIQFDLEGNEINRFESCKDASRLTGVCYSKIGAAAAGKRNSAGGFKWSFCSGEV